MQLLKLWGIISLMNIVQSAQALFLSALTILSLNGHGTPELQNVNQNIASASTGSSQNGKLITRDGQYTYNGQTLRYKVSIPLDGGKVTGQFNGICNGPITGTYKGPPSFAVDDGSAKVTCPILLYKKLSATYIAHLNLKEGKAFIDWVGDIPYTSGYGSFIVGFAPVD